MAQKIEVREDEVLSAIKKLRYAQEDIAEAYPGPAPSLSCAAQPTATQELDDMLDWAMVELKKKTEKWQAYLAVEAQNIKLTVQDFTTRDENFAHDLKTETGWVQEVGETFLNTPEPAAGSSTSGSGATAPAPGTAPTGSGGSGRSSSTNDDEDNG